MPYDPKNNLLFIHIPKNAGKSVEVFFNFVTEDEVAKYRFRSTLNRFATLLQRKTKDSKAAGRLWGIGDFTLCYQHLTLSEIYHLGLIDASQFESALKFAVVRNPWSRAVSTYKHFRGKDADPSGFEGFLEEWFDSPYRDHNELAHRRRQIDFLRSPDGQVDVNVLRFESLESDLNAFCSKFDLQNSDSLAHIGGSGRATAYRQFYSEKAKSLVEEYFAADIEAFGYSY